MTSQLARTTDQELLSRAHLRPVWDADGNLVGISELKVETDRRLGIKAMRDLFETIEPNDNVVGPDGWTLKQKRIINTPAPKACHYLKPTKRWDAQAGDMVQTVTILLPTEVVWTLFDLLFDGQYSVEIVDVSTTDEEVMPQSEEYKGMHPENMPGRRFFTRARVRLTVHLPNGKDRRYEGMGVAFGDVPMHKIGNITAINNELRTTEKGAISDAKREALAQIGPAFRRAFEDGDEMIDTIEAMLVKELRERNRPQVVTTAGAATVAAPAARAPRPVVSAAAPVMRVVPEAASEVENASAVESDATKGDVAEQTEDARPSNDFQVDFMETLSGQQMQVRTDAFLDIFLEEALGSVETLAQLDDLIARNARALESHVPDRREIEALRAELADSGDMEGDVENPTTDVEKDGIPDFDVEEEEMEVPASLEIELGKKSGKAVLDEFKTLFLEAKSATAIDAIIAANGKAIRKLTPRQMVEMTDAKSAALKALGA